MSFSRRKFLQQGTMAAIVCAGPLRILGANPGSNLPRGHIFGKTSGLTRQSFEGAVGSSFTFSAGGETVALQLAAVSDLPALAPQNTGAMAVPPPKSSSPAVTTEGFMLSFTGGPSTGLAQGTYLFESSVLGQFQLFIVPDGRTPQAYTAVFNQIDAAAGIMAPPRQLPGKTAPSSAPSADTVGAGNAGSGNAAGSAAGHPLQEPLEPVFRDALKSKLPE